MMEGCLETPKTSAPRLKTFVATYWLAPLIRLTTAITAATPMTTPMSVRTLRSLCAQRLEEAIATASERFIVDGLAMGQGRDRFGPHPNIRSNGPRSIEASCSLKQKGRLDSASKRPKTAVKLRKSRS